MYLNSPWARNLRQLDELINGVLSQQLAPAQADHLLIMGVTKDVENDLEMIRSRLGSRYVSRLLWTAVTCDVNVDVSGEDFLDCGFVMDGQLSQHFLSGLGNVRKYVAAKVRDNETDEHKPVPSKFSQRLGLAD